MESRIPVFIPGINNSCELVTRAYIFYNIATSIFDSNVEDGLAYVIACPRAAGAMIRQELDHVEASVCSSNMYGQ
jgi:hypothetical protein